MYHILFVHSSVVEHSGCFHVLAKVNTATVNIGVHVSFQITVSSRYVPRSWIAGSYSSSIFSFVKWQFPAFLAPGTGFLENYFSTNQGEDVFRMIQVYYIYIYYITFIETFHLLHALYFYHNYIVIHS